MFWTHKKLQVDSTAFSSTGPPAFILISSSTGRKGTLTVLMFQTKNKNGSIWACWRRSYATRIPLCSKHDCRNASSEAFVWCRRGFPYFGMWRRHCPEISAPATLAVLVIVKLKPLMYLLPVIHHFTHIVKYSVLFLIGLLDSNKA